MIISQYLLRFPQCQYLPGGCDRMACDWDVKRFCRENPLLVMTMISVVLGVSLGFGLRPLNLSPETLTLINFPGEIFMQVLKMMILPLIFSSLISALAQMDARESGQMGLATVLYYLTTTVLATLVCISANKQLNV